MYSYDDFLRAAAQEGWGENNHFSSADWNLAKKNPDAGMSLITAKKNYYSAKTPEERARANQEAENIRKQYGGYKGGKSGDGYILTDPSPNDFSMEEKKPEFSYEHETDPVYQAYQKQYEREGRRAQQNALGDAAAMTGGIPSTYAVSAATQAGDYYASQLSDKIPELYQAAYNRHLQDLNQWNTDRSFLYGQHMDEINSQTAARQEELQNALYGAQFGDYSRLQELGYNTDNVPEQFQKDYQLAQLAASMGDNSYLQNLFGIKPVSDANAQMQYQLAMAQAQLGDYSYLEQLMAKYFQ